MSDPSDAVETVARDVPMLDHTYRGRAYPANHANGAIDWMHPEEISGTFGVLDRDAESAWLANGETPPRQWLVTDVGDLRPAECEVAQ